jgi:type II secretion system protein H
MARHEERGTTLIELLVVLVLIALVSGLVGPAIGARIDNISLQSTATDLASQLRKAQALARAEQVPIVAVYANQEFRFLKQSKEVGSFKLPTAITLVSDAGAFVFLPTGQILAPHAIELENARGRRVRIDVSSLKGIAVQTVVAS